MSRRNLILLGLILSVAFNVGFLVSIAAHRYKSVPEAVEPLPEPAGCPYSLRQLSEQLSAELEPLRSDQAGLTRRLAELIANPETDRPEIERCLDQLSAVGRQVQAAVVDAVLAEKETLPEGERTAFCLEVHRCLCDSWSRSGFKSDCCANGCTKQPTKKEKE